VKSFISHSYILKIRAAKVVSFCYKARNKKILLYIKEMPFIFAVWL